MQPIKTKDQSKKMKSAKQISYIELENHCPLCSNELEIRVRSYLENYMLSEEAYCHHCDVRVRQKDHKMQ